MNGHESQKVQSSVLGSAGEHLAISYLLRRNLIAGLAPQNTQDFDIVVMSKNGSQLFPVQVKSSRRKDWLLSEKHQNPIPNLIYIFIKFSSDLMKEEIFIINSEKVAEVVKMGHQIWLKLPGKNNSTHKDSDMRKLKVDCSEFIAKVPNYEKYLTLNEVSFIKNHSDGWLDQYRDGWHLFQ